MYKTGLCLFAIGAAWFTLSVMVIVVMLISESVFGMSLTLPRIGHVDWGAVLVYFGLYFGSWVPMLIGSIFTAISLFLSKARPRIRRASRS